VQARRAKVEVGSRARFGTGLRAELLARGRARLMARHAGIDVGSRTRFGRGVRCDAPPGARIVIGDDVEISDWVILEAMPGGLLSIADGAIVGRGVQIAAEKHVSIGHESGVGEWSSIRDHDHDPAYPPKSMRTLQSDVRIGDRVWIGGKVTIVRGGCIGDGAVIAAHAVVNRAVPAGCLAGGVPVRVIREDVHSPAA
jgi:acetyltransferase-like isoleucine patch superfamily enzyme